MCVDLANCSGGCSECRSKKPGQVLCNRCDKPDDPVYLDDDGNHICGDCWMQDRANDPPDNPMPWELGR